MRAKTDPPDIVIYHEKGLYDFEIKRYRGTIEEEKLIKFLKDKILRYAEPLNFYIILQPPPYSAISLNVFEKLHLKVKELLEERDISCRICFSLNNNNKEMLSVHVYSNYMIYKFPLLSGSLQVKSILQR